MTDQPPVKTPNPVGQVLWWLLVIACCLWAVLELIKGQTIAAGAFAGAAVFATPPSRAWLKQIAGGRIPGWVTATVPFVLLLVAAGNSGPPTLPRAATPPAPSVRNEPVDVVANVVQFQGAYIGASSACKSAFQAIADTSQTRSPQIQDLYELTTVAQRLCRTSRNAIGDIALPAGLSSEERGSFAQARLNCGNAYFLAEQTAGKLKAALDDGLRPSKVAAYGESAKSAVAERTSCETSIAAAVETAVLAHRDIPVPASASRAQQ